VQAVAKAKGAAVEDVTVCILDRPRHEDLVREVREAGARIKFISDGDVAGAVMACTEGTGVDLLLGIGGTPEGIITACAVKCLGGTIQGKLWPQKKSEFTNAAAAGLDLDAVLGPTTSCAATTSSSSRPASPTASSCRASATAAAARPPSRW
jgi:fructose-1,6-bisphosphatase II